MKPHGSQRVEAEADVKDVTLRQLSISLLRGWRIILVCVSIGAIAGILVSAQKQKTYSASVRITPPLHSSSGATGGMLSSMSSIIGLNIGYQQNPNFSELQSLLHSNRLAGLLLQDPAFVQKVYPPPEWIEKSGHWVFRGHLGALSYIARGFLSWFGIRKSYGPTVASIAEYLHNHITILGRTNSIVTVSATGPSPEYPVQLLEIALRDADNILKRERKRQIIARINYLRARLKRTTVSDYRDGLITALTHEQMRLIGIDYGGPFSFFMLDEPIANETPISPRPILNLVVGVLFGFCVAAFVILLNLGGRRGSGKP